MPARPGYTTIMVSTDIAGQLRLLANLEARTMVATLKRALIAYGKTSPEYLQFLQRRAAARGAAEAPQAAQQAADKPAEVVPIASAKRQRRRASAGEPTNVRGALARVLLDGPTPNDVNEAVADLDRKEAEILTRRSET